MALEPGLYVAATPIGNLKDVTFRVVEALKQADLILCEDTRQTAKLCAAYDIRAPRAPYHEHNAESVRPDILARLEAGARICLVSDAGTPLISDPGYRLVRDARDRGIRVVPLPGPSAVLAALSAAGAPTDRFFFAGFVPAKAAARERFLKRLSEAEATLVFFETAPRLSASLASMAEAFGDRPAAIARELTKLHEEIAEGRLSALSARFEQHAPKGEVVVVVHPPPPPAEASDADIERFLDDALATMSVRDASALAAEKFGAARSRVYGLALARKKPQ